MGHGGVLCIQGVGQHSTIMLPVLVANQRIEGDTHRIGLQFRTLSVGQASDLFVMLEKAISI